MVNKIKILSFDVSSVSTGWAYIENDKIKDYGLVIINKKLSIPKKLFIFKLGVVQNICNFNPDFVLIEETYLKNVKTLKTLMQFIGLLNEASLNMIGKEPIMLSPNTARSYFGVKGKEEAFEFINNKFKLNLDFDGSNDITDAILQGMYYYNFLKEKKDGK